MGDQCFNLALRRTGLECEPYGVRVVRSSWWPRGRSFSHDGLLYSDGISLDQADALLALYDLTEELLKFKGPKLWYNQFREFLSGYKACLCLENSCEPYYFTEKFVNAARAGCVPVYHAHPTVAAKFLRGAKWVDPADHGFSPRRTIEYALAADRSEFQQANDAWLDSGILDETGFLGFWNKLHALMKAKLTDEAPAPMTAEKCRSFTS